MDKEQVIAALEKYEERLSVHGSFAPERLSEEEMSRNVVTLGQRRALGHVAWMCAEAKKLVEEDRIEKAMRWLGFIQGALWMASFFSINNLKVDNMPKGEKFDATRV
jgi:hypothetical protein